MLIGYDDEGTYGHPDHVRAHHLAVAASERTGVPLVQIASGIDAPGAVVREHPGVVTSAWPRTGGDGVGLGLDPSVAAEGVDRLGITSRFPLFPEAMSPPVAIPAG